MSRPMDTPTICCCGQQQCAYLQHNNAALDGLEQDLKNAAQIGQVCSFLNFNNHSSFYALFSFFDDASHSLHARHVTNLYTSGAACAP